MVKGGGLRKPRDCSRVVLSFLQRELGGIGGGGGGGGKGGRRDCSRYTSSNPSIHPILLRTCVLLSFYVPVCSCPSQGHLVAVV